MDLSVGGLSFSHHPSYRGRLPICLLVSIKGGLYHPPTRHREMGSVAESMGRIVGETPLPVEEAESGTVPRDMPAPASPQGRPHRANVRAVPPAPRRLFSV